MLNIENFDCNIAVFRFINSHHSSFFDNFFLWTRLLGRGEVILLILLFLLLVRRREDFYRLLISSLLTAVLVILLKNLLSAPRPASFLPDVHLLLPYYKNSFPSGDTSVATLILFSFFRKVNMVCRFLLLLYWLIISYGRVYLGVHFPLDILGGFLAAILCIALTPILAKRLFK
ncbi:MAG: phosphatase PAP2 family protein [Myxococcota bacterium]